MIGSRDIQPVQYNYLAAELTSGFIPLGSYVACYRVSRVGPKGPEPMADECVRININPLSPPLLNTPADKSILPTIYPQFSWLPPTPAEMFSNLNYDIAIAEVLPGQSPAEAILNNVLSGGYIVLHDKQEVSGISYIAKGELLVKYYSFDSDQETVVRFLTADGRLIREEKQKIIYGDNFLRFKLNNEFKKGAVYVIEITDQQKNIYNAKFSIQ
jgi:hypothetical protein